MEDHSSRGAHLPLWLNSVPGGGLAQFGPVLGAISGARYLSGVDIGG